MQFISRYSPLRQVDLHRSANCRLYDHNKIRFALARPRSHNEIHPLVLGNANIEWLIFPVWSVSMPDETYCNRDSRPLVLLSRMRRLENARFDIRRQTPLIHRRIIPSGIIGIRFF